MSCSIWQSQPVEAPRISLEFVHRRSEKLRRSVRDERSMFYIIAAAGCVSSIIAAFKFWAVSTGNPMNAVFALSALLFSLALPAAVLHVRKHLRFRKLELDSAVSGGLVVYRAELERMIKLACREWYVLIFFVPSYLTLLVGGLMFDQRPGKTMRYGLTVVAGLVSAGVALWVGKKKSRCLQRDLEAIKSM